MFILGNIINPQDFDQYILTSEDGSFYCGICNQAMNQKGHLKEHIEAKHFQMYSPISALSAHMWWDPR